MKIFLTILFLSIAFISCNSSTKTEKKGSALQELDSPTDSVSAEPYLFTDKNGVVYLSWIEKGKDSSSLKYSVFSNENWSPAVTITTGNNWFVNWADYPMIASDGANNLIAHILQKSAKGTYTYDVQYVTSGDKGKSWSVKKILHDDGKKAEHGFVSITPYEDKFFLSWLDGRNTVSETSDTASHTSGHDAGHHGAMSLRAAVITKQSTKSAEWELDKKVCDCCQTSTAITGNGPVVVYRDRTDNEIRDISIARFVDGKWTEPKTIFTDNWKIAACPVNGPRIDAKGNLLAIAWFSAPDTKAQVKVIFSEDGGATFTKPVRLDEENALGRVDVVMLDEKSAMVSWMEGAVIKAARVNKDGTKESSIIIASSSESRSSGFPQMTKSGNNLFFAWTDDKNKTIKVAKLPL